MCAHTRDGNSTLGLRFCHFLWTKLNFQRCGAICESTRILGMHICEYEIVYPSRSNAGWRAIFSQLLFCGGQTYLLGKTHFGAACLVASICVLVLVVVTEALVVINIRFLCMHGKHFANGV
jgi:hypothetical protein